MHVYLLYKTYGNMWRKESSIMIITYLGHSSFKIKGKAGVVVTDPFSQSAVGMTFPAVSADVITVSHQHDDHNATDLVKGTVRRTKPFIVSQPGDYEVGGISIFGVPTYHDDSQGVERGSNIVFTILMDDLRVCHLGDLGHQLSTEQIESIGSVDILLCPVGGVYTIDSLTAVKLIRQIEPSIVIPMHYKTANHEPNIFGELKTLADFLSEYGSEVTPQVKIEVTASRLPEETEVCVLTISSNQEK